MHSLIHNHSLHDALPIWKLKKDFPDFQIYSGFDEFFGHNVLSGGDGCVAGLSNFAPELAAGYVKAARRNDLDRKSTRLNSSHVSISYAVFCLKEKILLSI